MTRLSAALLCVFGCTSLCGAQTAAPADPNVEKPRVFITDSQSWEMEGSAGGSDGTFGAHSHGGARPQTAEIIKTFGEKCPTVTVNNMREKAAYIVVLDHEGGKGALRHKNKVAVFDAKSGDSIVSKSTLSLGGSVDEACRAIARHWPEHKSAAATADSATPQPASATASAPTDPPAQAHLSVTSIPDGADIEVDGSFMGNAPSSLQLQPGDHKVLISKSGYKPWQRTLKISGGEVNIKAELEKN
jgi:PEGA domain